MSTLELALAAVILTENLAILLFSVIDYDPPISRGEPVEESMRRRT